MTDVSLVHTSGGLIGDVITDSLRQPDVDGDAKFLTAVSTFTDLSGVTPTRDQLASDQQAAFKTCVALWSSYDDELKSGSMDVSRLRERLVLKLLEVLGFQPIYQRSKLRAGDQSWDISHLGWSGPGAPPIHTTAAVDLDERQRERRSPHEELQGYLNAVPERWGILTNGRSLRLLRDYHHTRTRGFVEFDLCAIFKASSWPDFLALWRLCHVSRFETASKEETDESADPDAKPAPEDEDSDEDDPSIEEAPQSLLEKLYSSAVSAGVAAGRRLQPQVRRAIRLLANGLMEANPQLRDDLLQHPDVGRELFRELLTVLYRTLFLLFAEQRGMLRDASSLYNDTYSLTRLRAISIEARSEPRRLDLWEGLKTTFRIFSDEAAAAKLGVYPYNGMLFDQDRTPLTNNGSLANHFLTRAIEALTTVQTGKVRMHVDYRNLGVEELGAVYESLLDYTLVIAIEAQAVDGHPVRPGEAYLAPLSIERADLASYYTPVELTDLLLTRSLDPLIEKTVAEAGEEPADQVAALLSLRIIDPACGSAAILVGALDRLAYAVSSARSSPHEPRDSDLVNARREVLQSCIFGAEKDPFAAELAKVALWIHCVVPDQPLTFLDHHIVCGDSLVGWPLLNVPNSIPEQAFQVSGAKGAEASLLTKARRRNHLFTSAGGDLFQAGTVAFSLTLPSELSTPELTPAEVKSKSVSYRDWINSPEYLHWKQAADLWTAAFFWNSDEPDARIPTTMEYAQALEGNPDPDLASKSASLIADVNPLHWPLAFPEAHSKGGFDLVLGNPPWEQYKGEEQAFFKQHRPDIAMLTSETRKTAIALLETTDPDLHRRWCQYRKSQTRLSHYAKTCGRYTRTSNEVNTYVLFTELAANSSKRAGLIVKSGIATDASQSAVWKKLLTDNRVIEVIDIVNQDLSGRRVFPAVAAVERFSILSLGRKHADELEAAMLNFGVEDAATSPARKWTRAELRTVSPRTETLLSSADHRELALALKLQTDFKPLDFADDDGGNPWGLRYARLFDSSLAKAAGLLLRATALEKDGYFLGPDKRYVGGNDAAVPVYEGQMANRWDHRARTFEGFAGKDCYGRKPHIPWVTDEQHADPAFEIEPRYWMYEKVARRRLEELMSDDDGLIAIRDIGRPWTDRRILRVAIMDRVPSTHTLPVLIIHRDRIAAAAALLNSMTMDFLVRLHMPGGHLTTSVLTQCAAPLPSELPVEAADLARKLSFTSERLARSLGGSLHIWNPEERARLDARCDALVAKAYGLTTCEYELILNHFKLLERIEQKEFGEYRSKRLRLEAFESVAGDN